MSDARTPPDLSMDEILATIRRIIAEDEQAGAPSTAADPTGAAAARGPEAAADHVLELTDALNEDGSVRRLAPIGSAPLAAGRLPEPPPPAAAEPDPQPKATPEPQSRRDAPSVAPARPQRSAANDEQLVADVTSLAAAAAFARLAATPRGPRAPPLLGDRPLEDVVRELLRPLLQTWLDENLPSIVERLVQAEIARISVKSGTV
jgi:cell pole-organizing protein PopZ